MKTQHQARKGRLLHFRGKLWSFIVLLRRLCKSGNIIIIVITLTIFRCNYQISNVFAEQVTVNGQHHCTSTAIVDTIQLSRRTDTNMANNMVNNMVNNVVNNMDNNMDKTDSANMSECTECNDTLSTCSRCDALLLDV